MRTIIEPFRIKSVEPIYVNTPEERRQLLAEAHYNLFLLKARDVLIDLLTDSGTSAMSSQQWAGMMQGDESYAGSESYFRFEKTIQELTGLPFVIPTHQGRAAEKILFNQIGGNGKFVLSNTLFDTTRANIEFSGATGIDILCEEGKSTELVAPFKGNMDLNKLRETISNVGASQIAMVMMTVTNNSGGGQPVSMENIREASRICKEHGILFYIDACRFAENSFFIKTREPGYQEKSIPEIAHEMFSYADGCTMSAKKDAFANMGGFLALKDEELTKDCRNLLVITEGFPTYGGLSGRDLEAVSIGLQEVMDETYLHYRIESIAYLGKILHDHGVPVMRPSGGHAIYLDAKKFLPNIPPAQYPGQALACELYIHGGIRSVEIGSFMFGKYDATGHLIPATHELVRLAIPRRVYTQSHIDYVAEVIIDVYQNRSTLSGYMILEEADLLRHFTAKLQPIESAKILS